MKKNNIFSLVTAIMLTSAYSTSICMQAPIISKNKKYKVSKTDNQVTIYDIHNKKNIYSKTFDDDSCLSLKTITGICFNHDSSAIAFVVDNDDLIGNDDLFGGLEREKYQIFIYDIPSKESFSIDIELPSFNENSLSPELKLELKFDLKNKNISLFRFLSDSEKKKEKQNISYKLPAEYYETYVEHTPKLRLKKYLLNKIKRNKLVDIIVKTKK